MARRSWLYCPGNEPAMMEKAVDSAADCVILDLEDAVGPGEKAAARDDVRSFLDTLTDPTPRVCVRTNPYDAAGPTDVDAVTADVSYVPDDVVLPKVDDRDTVVRAAERLSANDATETGLVPIVETASGLVSAVAVAEAPRVSGLAYGDQDFTADIGATVSDDKTESLYVREKVVVAAASAGVDAYDTVYTDIHDLDGLREQAEFVAGLGFDGKLAIHPDQVTVVNEAFTPTDEQIEWARRVLTVREEKSGVFEVDGQMIDPPLVERAKGIERRAKAASVW